MAGRKFGDVVRQLREAKGLSYDQLAERAQITRSSVMLLEAGQQGLPPRGILMRLARALGVAVEKLEG